MSTKVTDYRYGTLRSIASKLEGDRPTKIDDMDQRALFANLCHQLDHAARELSLHRENIRILASKIAALEKSRS